MQNINDLKFSVLSKLSTENINNIKLLYIFGRSGSEVIIVNKNDNVFAFGNNKEGLLGLGHTNTTQEPNLINELCEKQVVNIRAGVHFILALTKCGHLYSWGDNSVGQLGNGTLNADYNPKIIKTLFENKVNVIDISCGYYYSLILTNMGEVFGFGRNIEGQIGCGNNVNQLVPIKINQSCFNSEKIKSISCGIVHSLALTVSGNVYSWGSNGYGQLGIGNETNQNIPRKITLINKVIYKKIISGHAYSILLANDGYLYTFGYNGNGAIGNGTKVNQNIPTKLNLSIKFKDIASDNHNHISIATAMNGNCFVWGDCVNGEVMTPKETQLTSIHDIYAEYAKTKITYKPFVATNEIEDNEIHENQIIKRVADLFNNDQKFDLILKIDNKFIYTQKWFLVNLCKGFPSILPNNWLESNSNEIELKEYSYDVYYSLLKYFYTDVVDIGIKECIDLLDLANRLEDEVLKKRCIKIIKNNISDENICSIYSAAVKYYSEELEELCFKFSSNKLSQICRSDAFKQMDETSRSKFIIKAAELNIF